jgi:adenylate kinase
MPSKCAIVFVGPPGCGKGTQASFLQNKFGFKVFSAGEELRREIASGSALGLEIKDVCGSGGLVSDDIINTMVENFVANAPTSRLLFDGYPRKVSQAEALDRVLVRDGGWLLEACYFRISDEAIAERILHRFSCAKCGTVYNEKTVLPMVDGVCDHCGSTEFNKRNDDNEDSIKKRLETYRLMTESIIDFYDKRGILSVIDASLNSVEVAWQMKDVVGLVLEKVFEERR